MVTTECERDDSLSPVFALWPRVRSCLHDLSSRQSHASCRDLTGSYALQARLQGCHRQLDGSTHIMATSAGLHGHSLTRSARGRWSEGHAVYLCQAVHVSAAAGIFSDIQGSPRPNGQRTRLYVGQQIIHLLLKHLQPGAMRSLTAGWWQSLVPPAGWPRDGWQQAKHLCNVHMQSMICM